MNFAEYESCVHTMRLPEGSLWGLPVVLDIHDPSIKSGDRLLLRSISMGGDLAIMVVESIWKPDKTAESIKGRSFHRLNMVSMGVAFFLKQYWLSRARE